MKDARGKRINNFTTFQCIQESHSHRYPRVVPRDFFNESKLLKCMGFLALRILDRQLPEGITIEIDETGEPFDIQLTDDGSLTVVNYDVRVNGLDVVMKTTYNSKANFPLFCELDYEEFRVFNEQGEFDQEFLTKFQSSTENKD